MPVAEAAEFDDALNQIQAALTDTQHLLNAFLASASPALIPLAIASVALWDQILGLWESLRDLATPQRNGPGDPEALRAAVRRWNTEVGGPVSQEAGRVYDAQLAVDDNWDGSAANQYRQVLTPQRIAMSNVSATYTQPIGTQLEAMAAAIEAYYSELVVAGAGLVAVAIGALAAGTGAALLPGLAAIVAGLVVTTAAVISAQVNIRNAAAAVQSGLEQAAANSNGFVAFHWPTAVH